MIEFVMFSIHTCIVSLQSKYRNMHELDINMVFCFRLLYTIKLAEFICTALIYIYMCVCVYIYYMYGIDHQLAFCLGDLVDENQARRCRDNDIDDTHLIIRKYNYLEYTSTGSLCYKEISMLKSMLINKEFQTWHLIGWQQSRQPIRSHVRKPLLTYMEFNIDFI